MEQQSKFKIKKKKKKTQSHGWGQDLPVVSWQQQERLFFSETKI